MMLTFNNYVSRFKLNCIGAFISRLASDFLILIFAVRPQARAKFLGHESLKARNPPSQSGVGWKKVA